MTVAPVTTLAPAPAPTPTQGAGRLATVRRAGRAVRRWFANSPGRLRALGVAGVLAGLLAGAGCGLALQAQADALAEARAATAHLVLLQAARTELVRADADVTNAFLLGGLEPVDQRRAYLASLAAASRDIAVAARTGTGDAAAYGRAAEGLSRYAGRIEAARANNRQGLQVGANYLRIASTELRSGVLAELTRLADTDRANADAAYGRSGRALAAFGTLALLGVAALFLVQYRLARMTRSVLTVPAAVASAVLAVVLLLAAAVAGVGAARADTVRDGDAADATALAGSRTAAFDAKATESLTLVGRGSRPEGYTQWTAAFQSARDQAADADGAGGLARSLDAYASVHEQIADLDIRRGGWQEAVQLAVTDGPGSANAAFARFDADSAQRLGTAAAAADRSLRSARAALPGAAVAVLLAGLFAAVGVARGIAARLGEYR